MPPTAVVTVDTAFAPIATSPALLATAFGPMATESVPSACESASVELAWKYLMPPPVLMLLIVLPRLVMSAVLAAMSVVFCVTCWLVAKSCEPLIASVDELLSRPAATLVMVRSAPTAPTLTVLAGVVPAKL
ncbi:Tash protein PEST motif family [Mesorhizobium sp. LSJC268A00]|nr:Tash protein PEST motif family [Mesorhizobium sp. LSJC268A00]